MVDSSTQFVPFLGIHRPQGVDPGLAPENPSPFEKAINYIGGGFGLLGNLTGYGLQKVGGEIASIPNYIGRLFERPTPENISKQANYDLKTYDNLDYWRRRIYDNSSPSDLSRLGTNLINIVGEHEAPRSPVPLTGLPALQTTTVSPEEESPRSPAPLTGLPAYDARYSLSPEERQLQDQEPFIGSPFDNPDVGGRIPSWRGTPEGPPPWLEKTYSPLTEEQQAKLDAQKEKEEAAKTKAEAESQKRWEAALAGLAALEPKANIPIHAPSLQQVQPTVVRGGSSQAPTNIPMPTFTKQNTAPRILKFLR